MLIDIITWHCFPIVCRLGPIVTETQITLSYPNIAVDGDGNTGTWTMIYNQGFEVIIGGRSYFAFSYYEYVSKENQSENHDLHIKKPYL